ncbi:unnamed protein product [Onchocerca ochengi]|uniref:Uncharacterized protein n=2 Tax=Onchocerca TaxID=6281 RepID=A0A182E7X1_ONCOC|nr:unnamed protein product [Onchocerca ochengi]
MCVLLPSILIITIVAVAAKADNEIITKKNDSYVNESNQNFMTINSPVNNIVRTSDDHEWSETEENGTSLFNLVNGRERKQKVTPSESTKTYFNDNFEDLRGRISMETLDLIKQLHTYYFNTENLIKQPESLSSGENKSKKEEIVHVSGKLEILQL